MKDNGPAAENIGAGLRACAASRSPARRDTHDTHLRSHPAWAPRVIGYRGGDWASRRIHGAGGLRTLHPCTARMTPGGT